mmetsp:Transcript_2501/g.6240  ORF Transcript_2501/g.6240 Transcript_2501/m.6240 type:complete len:208 (+) Transcript_2501:1-624(+)
MPRARGGGGFTSPRRRRRVRRRGGGVAIRAPHLMGIAPPPPLGGILSPNRQPGHAIVVIKEEVLLPPLDMAMILMSIDLLPILLDALLVQHVVVVRARRRGVYSADHEAPVLDAGEGASPFIFITTPRCRHHAGAAGGGAGGRQRSPPAMPHPITLRTLRRGRRVESAEQYRIAVACGGGIRIRRRCGTSWILHFVVCGRIGRRLLL